MARRRPLRHRETACLDLKARRILPIHWATFSLALHNWTEPGERILAAARGAQLDVALPKPGESFEPQRAETIPTEKWWPDVAWQNSAEAPVVSSGLS